MRGNKEDIKQSILSMRRDLASSDLTKLSKSELVTMVCQRGKRSKEKTKIRRRRKITHEEPENLTDLQNMNKERSGILSSMGFECSGINLKHKNKNGTGFKEIFKCWGIARFQEFLRIFVMFWYSNNG
jgi:hypothetical protein